MKQIANKLKLNSGKYHLLHTLLVAVLPALLYLLIRIDFIELAVVVVLLSKWRIFAVRPRHWPANLRSNAVDMVVGVSVVMFMSQTANTQWQLFWAVMYGVWLLSIKPKSSVLWVGIQALLAQTAGLMAIYQIWADRSTMLLTVAVGVLCYVSARHFLSAFDDAMSRTIAYSWAYVCSAIAWLTGHWLVFYGGILAQPTLLITVFGYGMATLYYLHHTDKLSKNVRRQIVAVLSIAVFMIIMFSGNANKVI